MSKAIRIAKVSAKGGFNLFGGLTISTIISAIGVIIIARLLSPPEYGIVAIALMTPGLVTLFRDRGVNSPILIRFLKNVDLASFYKSYRIYNFRDDTMGRIVIDPKVRHSKPVIKGTRVSVYVILGSLAGGMSVDEITKEYGITRDDVLAAIEYAAKLISMEEIEEYA